MHKQPAVSCICLTYGRPDVLEEAIYCFLQQNYTGPKELIVLNDYDGQTLVFDHPEVRVINVPRRFRTVGEKRNVAIALASYNLLFPWDDDDIYLPHRLAFSVQKLDPEKGFFKPNQAWFWNNGQLSGPISSILHGGSCWSRALFDAVQGYAAEGSGHDQLFEAALAQRFPDITASHDIKPAEIYYLYRWGGTGSYHVSGFGGLKPGQNGGHNEVAAFVQRHAKQGAIPLGRVVLKPHWKTDYQQLVADYLAALVESV